MREVKKWEKAEPMKKMKYLGKVVMFFVHRKREKDKQFINRFVLKDALKVELRNAA